MRRDSIFYRLFQQSPTLLFELLSTLPANAADYRFDSVAVKEPKFEIDGVFLPPDTGNPGVVYFCEVQFQKDEQLYERLFGEAFLYFYRNRDRFSDWQAVVIYPGRSAEQSEVHPYRSLLGSDQVHRVYLNELGDIRQLPMGMALMLLTTVQDNQAPEEARYLLERSRQEEIAPGTSRSIMELVTTIMVYKFTQLSRVEVEAMLGLSLKETRVYQEAKEEGKQEGRQEGQQEGRKDEAVLLILRQLTRRLKQELPEEVRSQIKSLSLPTLEELGEFLVDFERLEDLLAWLDQHRTP
ncbi:MAG: Rpn family recombination-promoting nuclease/putative transposase [Drouetiella hepatica Uher 2000/2452]|jgi:predicted transposase/invertase (TIGR01784 family)|uniref:Rpn family recombination-promoting nuclease/putative transposase n=1 Tax=Drouetiella hepatica Uher 2000/2452 TaxID=904376 RepID=A0A951Q6H2_9CYAN|nr:Rpn family recombination-promoting nuclease/putative transposase [Drouetiella hepatica Uher 2000/2452]